MKKQFLWLKNRKFGKKFWIILVILAIIAGGFVLIKEKNSKNLDSVTVQKGTVKEELILTGSVNAEKYAKLMFPTYGKIAWVGVTEGQEVKKGQALTSLDKTTLNTAYQQALNNYRNYQAAAESALDSVKNHSNDETFTQKATRTAAEVNRDNAYDAVKAAQYNLANATIYAPFAGIISALPFTSPGVNVSLADVQVEIVDPATIYFDVGADQSEVISLVKGQDAVIVLDSYQDKEIIGKISFISFTPKAGEAGAVYRVKVGFAEGALGNLIPRIGMTGDAKFILSKKDDVLFVPSKFVNSDKEGKYVYLGKPGNKVRVKVGIEGEDSVEITSGVSEGDILYD